MLRDSTTYLEKEGQFSVSDDCGWFLCGEGVTNAGPSLTTYKSQFCHLIDVLGQNFLTSPPQFPQLQSGSNTISKCHLKGEKSELMK